MSALPQILLFLLLTSTVSAGESGNIEKLVLIQVIAPEIQIDLRYATDDNFMGQRVYPYAVCALQKETAEKLARANREFLKDGYRIKIWDAYRPLSVQQIFWDIVGDERYVANPQKGSRHNRGGAVDITLVDKNGVELEMPSAFDDFSPRAGRHNVDMSETAKKNVEYLTRVMTDCGFIPLEEEWWHFDDSGWKDFPLLNVSFEHFILKRINPGSSQAVLVRATKSFRGLLTVWERQSDGWKQIHESTDVVIGKNGFALPGEKKEGDGKTPSGLYALGTAFGYAEVVDTGLDYRQATDSDLWVDDPGHKDYNRWVRRPTDAKSFEQMKRDDDLYQYGIVIEYNTDPVVPGLGSAIFLHAWRNSESPTAGCVAVSEENLKRLLAWLDAKGNPVIITGEPRQ